MKRHVAAVLAAMLIGATAIPATQGQSFGIFFGDEPEDFFSERVICLTDSQIREAVADQGFTDVALNVKHERHVQVRGTRDGWVYLLDFNFCTGRIEDGERLRPAG